MNRRTGETPMDFEWEKGTGPIDLTSPFVTAVQQVNGAARKRPHSAFESPSKPQTPSLREPNNQPFFFSSTTNLGGANNNYGKPPPYPPPKAHLFNTPRKLDVDFSSGGETPQTPDNGNVGDSEATPDTSNRDRETAGSGFRFRMNNLMSSPGKKSGRRDSWMRLFTNSSPGKAEPNKTSKSSSDVKDNKDDLFYSRKGERRIARRRAKSEKENRNRRRDRAGESSDEEEDDGRRGQAGGHRDGEGASAVGAGAKLESTKENVVATIFAFIETHPNLPHILSFYAQLLLNVFLVFFVIYVVYSFWTAIRQDVDIESQKAIAEVMLEMKQCADSYLDNRCDRATRVPAMETICANWEKCMNRDPKAVGRARVSAHTFAQIFNSFIEPISYKAMIFTLALIFGCIGISNFAFGFFRTKAASSSHHPPPQQQPYPHQYIGPPPPTPQRVPSGALMYDQAFYTPYQNRARPLEGPGVEPTPSEHRQALEWDRA